MLCSKLHCKNGFKSILFSYKIQLFPVIASCRLVSTVERRNLYPTLGRELATLTPHPICQVMIVISALSDSL